MDIWLFAFYEILSSSLLFFAVLLYEQQRHKDLSYVYIGVLLLFAAYIIGVFYVAGTGTLYDVLLYKLEMRPEQIHIFPFWGIIDWSAYLLNVLLFVPFGMFAPLIWKNRNRLLPVLYSAFSFSLLIELSQLLNNRRCDIDDLLLNTLGGVIGFLIYTAWMKKANARSNLHEITFINMEWYIAAIFIGRFLFFNEMGWARLLYRF
ncbi:MAG: VanZ family protein [Erysipelotrichaceae bacterium]|jgi:glycopeptide antibiotics resistance protein|nr:VanZ family protein [Erysipelotrichaceae bacterium]